MKTIQEQYDAAKASYDTAKSAMLSLGRDAFKVKAAAIFEAFPTLQSFGWTQYTPYFNDGDVCVFSVNRYDDSVKLNGRSESDDDETVDDLPKIEDRSAPAEEISALLGSFDDELMQEWWGDHVEVTLHRDGRSVIDEYEHD